MVPGQYLESPSKRFKLLLQPDINLALYDNGALAWVADNNPYTTTSRNPNNDLVNCFYVHTTGILVDHSRGRAWMTTNGVPVGGDKGSAERTFVQVQDDGNLVIVESVPFGRVMRPFSQTLPNHHWPFRVAPPWRSTSVMLLAARLWCFSRTATLWFRTGLWEFSGPVGPRTKGQRARSCKLTVTLSSMAQTTPHSGTRVQQGNLVQS